MGKKSKTLLVALVMVAIILSAFIGCAEDETPDYKADFLGELKTAVTYSKDNISITMSGENITVTLTGATSKNALAKADSLATELRKLADPGTTVTIGGETFSLHVDSDLSALQAKLRSLFDETKEEPYKAAVKYKGQSFELNGKLSVTR